MGTVDDRYRYHVLSCTGAVLSRHHSRERAIRSARAEVCAQGLEDDGAYCAGDGWPSIVDRDHYLPVDY